MSVVFNEAYLLVVEVLALGKGTVSLEDLLEVSVVGLHADVANEELDSVVAIVLLRVGRSFSLHFLEVGLRLLFLLLGRSRLVRLIVGIIIIAVIIVVSTA